MRAKVKITKRVMLLSFDRDLIVQTTLSWIGTPYHHQAYTKGVGVDCLGLLRGVFIELYEHDPEPPPRYSPSWGEANSDELLLKAARTYLEIPDYQGWRKGDILVFRVKNAASAKHCAIVCDEKNMIHAVSHREVMQTNIGAWSKKIAGVFKFPGVV